jgi:redox-regulated HSP33 family molecular chaperone
MNLSRSKLKKTCKITPSNNEIQLLHNVPESARIAVGKLLLAGGTMGVELQQERNSNWRIIHYYPPL